MFWFLKNTMISITFMGLASCASGQQFITADDFYRGIYEINVQEQQWIDGPAPNRIEKDIPSYHEYKFDLQEIREAQKL